MSEQGRLFDWLPAAPARLYPRSAGFKEKGGTSEKAAKAVDAEGLRRRVLAVFPSPPTGLTADEAAALVGEDRLNVRPRVTELGKLGELVKTKTRRKNRSGASAAVWTRRTA